MAPIYIEDDVWNGGIEDEQVVECRQLCRRQAGHQGSLHATARDRPGSSAETVEGVGGRQQSATFPQCGEYRLGNRLPVIRRIGGFKCSGEGRSKIVLVYLSQAKMALHLQRMLAPVLTPAAVFAQSNGRYVDLVGDERDQGCRRNFVMTPASTEIAHEAGLDSQAELVVGRRLRPDEIEVRLPQRVVADQGLLVRWRVEERRPSIGFEQGSLRHGGPSRKSGWAAIIVTGIPRGNATPSCAVENHKFFRHPDEP